MLKTLPYRQRMCSTAERKWRLYFQTLLVFTRIAHAVEYNIRCSCKEHVFGSSPNVGTSFLNFIIFIFMYVVLAQIIVIEIVLVYYWNDCLKTSAYNSYQQQLQMDTQSVFTV
jgi:hypothetical protein